MSIALCINGRNDTSYPSAALNDARTCALDCVADYAAQISDIADVYYLSADGTVPAGYPWQSVVCSTVKGFLTFAQSLSDEITDIIYIHNDTPLINGVVTAEMIRDHRTYHAEYTFAEGYPSGFAPEILSREGILHLNNLCDKDDTVLKKGALFDLVSKDINSFDLETKISDVDMRSYRLTLGMDTKQEFLVTRKIYQACTAEKPEVDEKVLTSVITGREELQRSLPVYASIQLTDGCPQKCSYCPYPVMNPSLLTDRNYMKYADYMAIIKKLKSFMEGGYVSLSPFGEPALHPDIYSLASGTVSEGFTVVIETSGIGWDKKHVAALIKECGPGLLWIVSMDAPEPELYARLRGEGYNEAFDFASFLVKEAPSTAYVQCVRMKENEDVLEPFYRFWKERTDNIIIQKYDWFAGFLPSNTVSDISPVHRNVCWHLKRDLTVLMDGTVPLCKEDAGKTRVLGNMFTDTVEEIWERALPVFMDHTKKRYPGICEGCDEYYTYNF
ncbi:MAG: spiro-SPASM protein [Spirochaetales bacterium]|nr:spiro-SPASM protein [Spirochaetales bacterium]